MEMGQEENAKVDAPPSTPTLPSASPTEGPASEMLTSRTPGADSLSPSEGPGSPSTATSNVVPTQRNLTKVEQYRAKRARQVAARRRGPFIRDAAPADEFPGRVKASAYRVLTSEIPEESMSAHHLIEFRKYVDSLLEDVQTSDIGETLHERELDDAVRGQTWWSLPRVEHWLTERVKTWAQPIKEDSISAPKPIKRFCQVSAYAAKGTRQSMEDYFCTYLHWGNLFSTEVSTKARVPITENDERGLAEYLTQFQLSTGEERQRWLKVWLGENNSRFIGVFDGHGGSECAAYVRDLLPITIISSEHFPHDIEQACITAFQKVNASFISRATKLECDAGTTALIAMHWGQKIYLANVGDCHSFISRKGDRPLELTPRHTPDNAAEAAAVERRGGSIQCRHGKLRVDGLISITRGFGCKPCTNHTSCVPDCVVHDISPNDDFLVLASDGLWDVMTPQDVEDFVKLKRSELLATPATDAAFPLQDIAVQLSSRAIQLGSLDNVTCLIAFFDQEY
eukprot:TRINITY_DN1671_c0_g1_i1.p1 TRINITY_DN1671_c0_g1~~TRINITY_DN1671_c0_g1_i1.p1  ORF type:complete len:526 (+),score=159.89 TRINITY_DN1671_c0_g1_i1:47-1579(+)